MLRKLEEWITRHIPAQRARKEELKRSMERNGSFMSRKWDDLPNSTKERLKQDPAIMHTVNIAKREADRSHVNY